MNVSPRAGQPADSLMLVNPSNPVTAYYIDVSDSSVSEQGTENIYEIYAESFWGADHLRRILEEAQTIVGDALAASPQQPGSPSEPTLKEHL